MNSVPDEVCRRLQAADQSHLTMWWGHLTVAQQQTLLQQIQKLDLEQIGRLTDRTGDHHAPPKAQPPADRVSRATAPSMVIRQPQTPEEARAREEAAVVGRQLLGEGKVAVVTVAGGQGSRLGFEHPKGMYPIGPLTSRSLFQIFAEQIQARSKKCGRDIPWLIMTSSTTHDETTAFFEAHHYFGLQRDQVFFFPQADLPAVDAATGKLLLREKHELNLAPDGHGGLVTALAAHGLLDRLAVMGIEDVFYHQVDNPAVIICDPVLIGLHRIHRSELTTNVVRKLEPSERMGVLAEVDGRIEIIEYSEMSLEDASRTDANGDWIFWAGNTAIHVFSLEFLRRLTSGDQQLELHVARKVIPFLNDDGQFVEPEEPNALKFERFIFDALPLARNALIVEGDRDREFHPVKNADGKDSPATAQAALSRIGREWLRAAGCEISDQATVEISPVVALDADELRQAISAGHVDVSTFTGQSRQSG